MRTLRKHSQTDSKINEYSFIIMLICRENTQKLRNSVIDNRKSQNFSRTTKAPKPPIGNRIHKLNPASPSSSHLIYESSSSIGSVNELYENYKEQMMAAKGKYFSFKFIKIYFIIIYDRSK